MKFYYDPVISNDPISGEPHMILRPKVLISVEGASKSAQFHALVDTGADNTVLPLTIARQLEVVTKPTRGIAAETFGGEQLTTVYGEVTFKITDENEEYRWTTTVLFYDFDNPKDETAVLGHAGFLNYFTANFDGLECVLTLTPNEDLPVAF